MTFFVGRCQPTQSRPPRTTPNIEKFRYTDNDSNLKITSGDPGIGFYIDPCAPNNDFGFTRLTVTASEM